MAAILFTTSPFRKRIKLYEASRSSGRIKKAMIEDMIEDMKKGVSSLEENLRKSVSSAGKRQD